jgi:hypothetical protein
VGSVGRNESGNGNGKWDQLEDVAVEMGSGIIEDIWGKWKWETGSVGRYGRGNGEWGGMEAEIGSGEVWKRKWEMRSAGRYGSETEKKGQWGDMEVGTWCGKLGDMEMEIRNGISGRDGTENGCRISFEIWNYGSENEESGIIGEIWTKVMRNEISGKI